jgi:CrcB protein
MMLSYLLVAAGSAIGGTLRYWLAALITDATTATFPWGTLVINITGSIVIGFFSTLTGTDGRFLVPIEWRNFVMVGICGGYTTFSSFSLQTLSLAQGGNYVSAAANVVGSVILCLLGVWIGHTGAMFLNE